MQNGGPDTSIAPTSTPIKPKIIIFEFSQITTSLIFLINDAKVASTGPGTHLKRCASKFRFGWWSGHLHRSHMDPIGEKTVSYSVNSSRWVRLWGSFGGLWGSFGGLWVPFGALYTSHLPPVEPYSKSSVWCRRAPTLGHAPDLPDLLRSAGSTGSTGNGPQLAARPMVPRAGRQDDGS